MRALKAAPADQPEAAGSHLAIWVSRMSTLAIVLTRTHPLSLSGSIYVDVEDDSV
jgi:hypothetical protein